MYYSTCRPSFPGSTGWLPGLDEIWSLFIICIPPSPLLAYCIGLHAPFWLGCWLGGKGGGGGGIFVYKDRCIRFRFSHCWLFSPRGVLSLASHCNACSQGEPLTGTVQRDVRPPDLVHHSNSLTGPLTIGFKYFRFRLWIRRVIPMFWNLPGVWYAPLSQSPRVTCPGESISPSTATYPWESISRVCDHGESLLAPESQQPFLKTVPQAFKGQCHRNSCIMHKERATFFTFQT